MKKTIIKVIIATVIAVLVCFAITGCGSENKRNNQTLSTVIGVANNRNSAAVDPSVLDTIISESVQTHGNEVGVYEIDGAGASKVYSKTVEYKSGQSKANIEEAYHLNTKKIRKAITAAAPTTKEVDLLQGITKITNAAVNGAYATGADCRLVIVSNLLSTKGVVDFTATGGINFDKKAYIDFITPNLPDMSSIKEVIFITAEAAGEQKRLNNKDIDFLQDFWQQVLTKAGVKGKITFINATAQPAENDADWPEVTPIDIVEDSFKYPSTQDGKIDITLDASTLFLSDSTDFANEKEAKSTLAGVVQSINAFDGTTYIVGSTATTSSSAEQHVKFGEQRAVKVVKLLVELGVEKSKLKSISVGKEHHTWRCPDDFAGNSANRSVFIVSENTSKATEFIRIASRFPDINNGN